MAAQHYLDTIVARMDAKPANEQAAAAWAQRTAGLVVVEDHDGGEFLVMPGWAAEQYRRYHDAEVRDDLCDRNTD